MSKENKLEDYKDAPLTMALMDAPRYLLELLERIEKLEQEVNDLRRE